MMPTENDYETCKRMVQFLRELHHGALDHAKSFKFGKTHALHFALVSLYGSLIELAGCMLTLLENRGKIGIPSIFRTFLETYVEFHNLVREPSYGYYMDANDLKESIKRLKTAKGGNPYLAGIASMLDLSDHIVKMELQLKDLASKGFKPMPIYERFKRADMVEEYQSLYSSLCSNVHSNKEALVDRHVELGNNDFELVLYKNPPDERFLYCLGPTAELLISATIDIHEHFQSEAVDEVRLLKIKLADVCSSEMKPTAAGLPQGDRE